VSAALEIDAAAETYVANVLDAFDEAGVSIRAAYLLGSAATGDFDPATSDLDVVAVVDRPLGEPRAQVVDAIGRLGSPVRALELVVYVEGHQPPDFELNVNADASGAVEKPDEPAHWFVIDAALAQDRAVPFGGDEPWSAHFEPVTEDRLREALVQSIAWSQAQPIDNAFARVNAIRSRHYLETGEWLSKREAAK
jgi:predicted nucleotidyltransferase